LEKLEILNIVSLRSVISGSISKNSNSLNIYLVSLHRLRDSSVQSSVQFLHLYLYDMFRATLKSKLCGSRTKKNNQSDTYGCYTDPEEGFDERLSKIHDSLILFSKLWHSAKSWSIVNLPDSNPAW
jgi:hypothetical protein